MDTFFCGPVLKRHLVERVPRDLHFAETYWDDEGWRIFDVFIEGEKVLGNLDLYATVGKELAFDFSNVASVRDGHLGISFHSKHDDAQVCGVLVQTMN